MDEPVLWIDKPAIIEADGDAFIIKNFSGDAVVTTRVSRHLLRRFIEEARRELDAAEAADHIKAVARKEDRIGG